MGRKEILKQIFFILFLCIFGRCLQAVIITWGPASGTIDSAGCAVRQWPPPCALAGVGGGAEYCHSPTVYRLLMSSLKTHQEKCETIKPHRIVTTTVTNTRFKHHARARQRSV